MSQCIESIILRPSAAYLIEYPFRILDATLVCSLCAVHGIVYRFETSTIYRNK